jgi:CubicO group peptidase (beta-lactamase class C family)
MRAPTFAFGAWMLATTGAAAQGMAPAARAALDSLIDLAVEREYAPGLGVAIVRDGKVIYQRGAGWADKEAGRRVDSTTLFYIASSTKSFTALATVLLDRVGVLKLDQTLAQILPGVRMAEGLDPAQITVRQLLTHTHGISGEGPVSYRAAFSGEIDRSAMIRAIAAHEPARDGTTYAYSNLGYNILSLAIDSLAGKPWQDVLAERVFRPLGLRATSARVSELPAGRLAMPYRAEPEGIARLPYGKHDANMQAAGGMIASIGDLARFVIAIMDGGMLDGRRVFPADVVAETQRVHARFSSRAGAIDRFGYGLGWNFGLLDGDTLVHHFGGFPGFSASVSFMPRHRIGVVQGGNGALSTPMHDLVMGYAYALLTGNVPALERYRQQIAALPQRAAQQRAAIAADRARRAARPQTTALPLEAYAGRYADEVFGTIDVTFQDGRIRARNGVLESVAEVYDGTKHMLRVELTPGSGSVLEFLVTDGRVTGMMANGRRLARVAGP